jgi:hypothetical protein
MPATTMRFMLDPSCMKEALRQRRLTAKSNRRSYERAGARGQTAKPTGSFYSVDWQRFRGWGKMELEGGPVVRSQHFRGGQCAEPEQRADASDSVRSVPET